MTVIDDMKVAEEFIKRFIPNMLDGERHRAIAELSTLIFEQRMEEKIQVLAAERIRPTPKTDGRDVPLNEEDTTVDDLLARGAEQISRKYRHVACLPEGMTGLQALAARSPTHFLQLMTEMEKRAGETYRRYVSLHYGDSFTLTIKQFNEFLVKTGRAPNKFLETEHEQCPSCQTLGHQHRKDCIFETKNPKEG